MINKVMYAGSNLMPRNNASKVAFGDYGDDLERSLKGMKNEDLFKKDINEESQNKKFVQMLQRQVCVLLNH